MDNKKGRFDKFIFFILIGFGISLTALFGHFYIPYVGNPMLNLAQVARLAPSAFGIACFVFSGVRLIFDYSPVDEKVREMYLWWVRYHHQFILGSRKDAWRGILCGCILIVVQVVFDHFVPYGKYF
ncbi:MAG: hypothetical protein GXO69_00450 [Acidobacteria bacterium]|nr:hypothetical protein [Acidobacteriota bacterium]